MRDVIDAVAVAAALVVAGGVAVAAVRSRRACENRVKTLFSIQKQEILASLSTYRVVGQNGFKIKF